MSWIKRTIGTGLLLAAVTAGGVAVAPSAVNAATNPVVVSDAVQPAIWRSGGIHRDRDCLELADAWESIGVPAYCWWHPPISIGYSELRYYL